MRNSLYSAFIHYSRLTRLGISHHSVAFALDEIGDGSFSPQELLENLLERIGLAGPKHLIGDLEPDQLPSLVWLPQNTWGVAEVVDKHGGLVVSDGKGGKTVLDRADIANVKPFAILPSELRNAGSALGVIANSLLRHRSTLVHAGVATALVNVVTLVSSVYSMQVYDRVIPTNGMSTLAVLTAGATLAALIEFALRWLRGHAIDQVAALVDTDVSRQLVGKLLSTRLDARPTQVGTLAAQVKGFDHVRQLMTSGTFFFSVDLPFALLFMLVIALIGGWAVVPPIFVVVFSALIGLHAAKRIQRLSEKSLADGNRKLGVLVESLEAGETVKANCGEWRIMRRWNHLVEQVAISELQLRNHNGATTYVTTLLQGLGYVALIATGAVLAMQGQLTTGGLLACSILNGRVVAPLLQLPTLLMQWTQAKAALKVLNSLFQLPSDSRPDSEQLAPELVHGALQVDDLHFGYPQSAHPCLSFKNSFRVQPGERVGVLGEVGSGKSTLLKLLAGLYQPQGGQVRLDGIDLKHLKPDFLRHQLGYLAQDYRLVSGTLRENLTLGIADPGDAALLQVCEATGLIQLINSNPKGLALPIYEGGRGVSGGQRQLVGLTRLLLSDSKIWLLDEPTASLDGKSEATVLAALRQRTNGKTLIVVTHKVSLLPLFDRLIVVSSGKVLIDGPRDAVLAHLGAGSGVRQGPAVISEASAV